MGRVLSLGSDRFETYLVKPLIQRSDGTLDPSDEGLYELVEWVSGPCSIRDPLDAGQP